MNKRELMDEIEERYDLENMGEYAFSDIIDMVLETYADLRLPELQERLKKYEGSQYKTFGKIEELEDMKDL